MNEYDAYTTALWYLNFAKISHHPRYDTFEAALKKAGVATWSLDDKVFRQYLLQYFGGEFKTIFPDKTEGELNSTVPIGVVKEFMPQVIALHQKQRDTMRRFSHDLVRNFLSVEARNLVQTTLEEQLPDVIRDKSTLQDIETEVQRIVADKFAQSGQPTSENEIQRAIETVRPTTIDLMVTPRVFAQATTAAVAEKKDFSTILTHLVRSDPTIPIERHAIKAEALTRTLEATNATVIGGGSARASGNLLIALAQEGKKPLGVAVASLLSPQMRDRIFDAVTNSSWERAVDNITRKAATLALDQGILQDIVNRGNKTFGVSTGKGGMVAARGFAEALWGNIAGPMENYIQNQYDLAKVNTSLPQHQRFLGNLTPAGAQAPLVTNGTEFFIALLYIQGSSMVTMRGEAPREGGGFLRFVLSWGSQEAAGKLVRDGISAAAGKTSGTLMGRFLTFLGGIFGARAGGAAGATAGAAAGGPLAPVTAALGWIVGSFIMPALRWAGGLFGRFARGEIGPWGVGIIGIGGYVRDALGGAYGQVRQWYDNPLILLPVVLVVVILLPVIPILNTTFTPIPQITTQNAALLTSYEKALVGSEGEFGTQGGLCDPTIDPSCVTASCDPTKQDCRWPTSCGCIIREPFEKTHAKNHLNAVDVVFDKCAEQTHVPVFATQTGTVIVASSQYRDNEYYSAGKSTYGNYVQIQGDDPAYQTLYGHLSTITVRAGEHVTVGQQIGTTDNNGISGGEHLHFEVRGLSSPLNGQNTVLPKPGKDGTCF